MKKFIYLFAICIASFTACKKEHPQPNNGSSSGTSTQNPTTGTLYFKNTQTDPYTITLDGTNVGTLSAGTTSQGFIVTSGIGHSVKATQYSGYVLYPTIFTGTATLNPGGSITWSF